MRVPTEGDQPSIMFIHLSEILAGDRSPRQDKGGENQADTGSTSTTFLMKYRELPVVVSSVVTRQLPYFSVS